MNQLKIVLKLVPPLFCNLAKWLGIHFRRVSISAIFTLIILCSPLQFAKGQTHDSQLWNSLILDYLPSPNLQLEMELIYNLLLSEGPQWYEYAMQPSVEYYPNNSIDLFAATYLSTTQQNDDTQTNEIRPILGFRWNMIKPEKRVFLRTQVKYEYRIFTDKTTDDVINSGRVRMRLDLFVPITKKAYNQDGDLYGIIWSEIYLGNDERINEKYFKLYNFVHPL